MGLTSKRTDTIFWLRLDRKKRLFADSCTHLPLCTMCLALNDLSPLGLSWARRLARLWLSFSRFPANVKWSVPTQWQAAVWMPQGHRQLKLWGWSNKHLTEMIIITSGEAALCGLRFTHRKQICSYVAVMWTRQRTQTIYSSARPPNWTEHCLSLNHRGLVPHLSATEVFFLTSFINQWAICLQIYQGCELKAMGG